MKIGISGYFGYANFGDELFLKTWQQIFKDCKVHAIQSYEDISNLDAIIIGGGDLLIPNFFTSAYWNEIFLTKPVYVYGIGVPIEIKHNEEELSKYRNFLQKCKYVSVRDNVSREFMITHNLCDPEVVEDVVWSYENPGIQINKFNIKTIGFTIRPNPRYALNEMVQLVCQIALKKYKIKLIPLQPSSNVMYRDDTIHNILMDRVKHWVPDVDIELLPDAFDIDHRWSLIGACDYYIGMRMHGLVAALSQAVPCMALGDSNKFPRIMEKFELVHLSKNYSDTDFIDSFYKLIDKDADYSRLKDHGSYLKIKSGNELKLLRKKLLEDFNGTHKD